MQTREKVLMSAIVLALGCAAAIAMAGTTRQNARDTGGDLRPTGKGYGEPDPNNRQRIGHAGKPGGGSSNGIFYHGGPVMLGTTNVYYIWYGNWSGNSATSILYDLAHSMGGSPYYNINTTYSDGSNNHVANSVAYGGATNDN